MHWIVSAMLLVASWSTMPTGGSIAISPPMPPVMSPAHAPALQSGATPGPLSDAVRASGVDLTCSDFVNQAAAQTALDADSQDPNGLDLDLDGVACEAPFVTPVVPQASPPPLDGRSVNCVDFAFQEDAQVVFDRIPGDPYNLDPSGDGLACSSLPSRAGK